MSEEKLTPITREEHFLQAIADAYSQGGGGDSTEGDTMRINFSDENQTVLDHTYKEIADAVEAGKVLFILTTDDGLVAYTNVEYLTKYASAMIGCSVIFGEDYEYQCDTVNDYPTKPE